MSKQENKKPNFKPRNKGSILIWSILIICYITIIAMTFMKSPIEITELLTNITTQLKIYFAVIHGVFIVVIITGLIFKEYRNKIFFGFMLLLSISATIISIVFIIIPNIIIFTLFSVLLIASYQSKELNFNFKDIRLINVMFGILGLFFGFWYLHWVEPPVWLNALLYSPIGGINCPTMVTLCGFLCITSKTKSSMLEVSISIITIYFGFFGIFILGAYIDIVLIMCGSFLALRSIINWLDVLRKENKEI